MTCSTATSWRASTSHLRRGEDSVPAGSVSAREFWRRPLPQENKTVKKAGENDTVIGQVITNPKYDGTRPQQASSSGNYNMRICTVRLFGYYVHNVKLTADNSAVSVGGAVGYVGGNEFDKVNSGNAIALISATALSGAKIPVLMGLLGF